MQAGIRKIATAVGSTMGTAGSNAILEAIEYPGHLMTNDGWTIANAIVLADPLEDMGRKVLLESINRANKASGDGSSTTCVLTAAMIEEGIKRITEAHPMEIKRQIEACLSTIEENVKAQTRAVAVDSPMLEQVATISAEDPAIGKRIAEIYGQIGAQGIIHWDISRTAEDTYTIGSGITVEGAGYYTPYMCDADENGRSTNQIRIKNPFILLTQQKLSSSSDFNEIAQTLNGNDVKDLVVFVDEIDPLMIPDLIKTRAMRGFRIVIVKMPVLWKDLWYEDLAKATGARIVNPSAGLPMKDVHITDLGRCANILITKEDTYLDGIKDVSEHIKTLEETGTDDSKLRASRLNTKTARYFVGAHSDSALSHRRLKVEDAISAASQALNGGVVPGGGSAFLNISAVMPNTIGGAILKAAFEAPARQIRGNTGLRVPDAFLYSGKDVGGFDTRTGKEVSNMFDAGIIDPANIVLNAAKNAVSVAAAIITAKTVVTFPREEQVTASPPVVSR